MKNPLNDIFDGIKENIKNDPYKIKDELETLKIYIDKNAKEIAAVVFVGKIFFDGLENKISENNGNPDDILEILFIYKKIFQNLLKQFFEKEGENKWKKLKNTI